VGTPTRPQWLTKPEWLKWEHNRHYHDSLLAQVPSGCRSALDVGCGAGRFTVRLAERAGHVVGLDRDMAIVDAARRLSPHPRVEYRVGDLFDADLPAGGFDAIACIAALHHMDLRPALERLGALLTPGGVLVVLGLHRVATPFDALYNAAVLPLDLAAGAARHRRHERDALPVAPLAPLDLSLRAIRRQAQEVLPGAVVRRRLYLRYSLVYNRPGPTPAVPISRPAPAARKRSTGGL
jgi:SAM-dependent methyltransferase